MVKATFVLDEDTIRMIRLLAERQDKPQSHVVREAVAVYASQGQKLTIRSANGSCRLLDQLAKRPATRQEPAVDAELQALRRSRRAGWRRGPSDDSLGHVRADRRVHGTPSLAPGRAASDRSQRGDDVLEPGVFEWLRGPRTDEERLAVEAFFASDAVAVFGVREAELAAALYRQVKGARQRQADLSIAACAIEHGARLWTLNTRDFNDIPGLRLYP